MIHQLLIFQMSHEIFASSFQRSWATDCSSQAVDLKLVVKGSSDQSYFIFDINVGKGRIRHRTTLNLIKF